MKLSQMSRAILSLCLLVSVRLSSTHEISGAEGQRWTVSICFHSHPRRGHYDRFTL